MVLWTLSEYVSPMGRRAITDWRRKDVSVGAPRAALDTFLKKIVKTRSWKYPDIDFLKGNRYLGLTELRWKWDGKPYRIFGYQLAEFEYLMLVGCTHDQKKYNPPDALETARRRRKEVEKGKASYCEYPLITDP